MMRIMATEWMDLPAAKWITEGITEGIALGHRDTRWVDDDIDRLVGAIEADYLTSLRILDLTGSADITGKSLVSLATALGKEHLPKLQSLLLGGLTWGDDGVIALAQALESGKLVSLEKLDLSGSTGISGKSLVRLAVALGKFSTPILREVFLGGIGWENDGVLKLVEAIESGSLGCLKLLDLSDSASVSGDSWMRLTAALGKGPTCNLRDLLVRDDVFGDDGVHQLAKIIESGDLMYLEILDFSERKGCSEESLARLASSFGTGHMAKLKRLILRNVGLGNQGACNLVEVINSGKLPSLQILDVTKNSKIDEFTRALLMSLGTKLGPRVLVDSPSSIPDRLGVLDFKTADAKAPEEDRVSVVEQANKTRIFGLPSASSVQEGRKEIGCRDGAKLESDVAGNESGLESRRNEALQFRLDVQRLGFSSFNEKWDPGCTLVLGDVTGSAQELHFVFFHTEAMIKLFGCGLPCSKVTILLDKRLIWFQELAEETWKAFWMNSYQGCLRPFLCQEKELGREDNPEGLEPELFDLTKSEALSKFGIGIDGLGRQQFVKLSGHQSENAEGKSGWEPAWVGWLRTVNDHAFPNGSTPPQLHRRMEDLSIKSPPGTEASSRGREAFSDETAQGANPRLQNEAEEGADPEWKSLVVVVTFSCADWPFFEYSSNREVAREIAENRETLPQQISYMQPELTVAFFREKKEKCVNTTLEVEYQMKCQDAWPSGWFQNDLRISFRSNDADGFLKKHGIKGIDKETDTTSQYGGSSSNKRGFSMEGTGQGSVSVVTANGKVSKQDDSTAQTTWSDQNKYRQSRRVLESDKFFGVSDNSYGRTMEGRALYYPTQDPSMFYCRNPHHRFDHSGLRADVRIEAEAGWELSGKDTHAYVFEASKELTQCTVTQQENDGERPRKWLKMFSGESLRPFSNPQDQDTAKVKQDKFLQIFRKKFFLNHNFDEFFPKYCGAYRWKIIEESPVQQALRDERSTAGEKPP